MSEKADLLLINDGQHANSEYLAAVMTWPDDFSRCNNLTEAAIKNFADAGHDRALGGREASARRHTAIPAISRPPVIPGPGEA